MARRGVPSATIVRALQPLSVAVGRPAPSYSSVARLAAPFRPVEREPDPYVDEIVTKLLAGRFPDLYKVDVLLARRADDDR
jgi:hypothetical protein